ncbi:MAG: BrnT family toxin [Verrucomicrobium sp.]|nr:BrnT family toxin [Verrucomicrobium sp.]
MEWDEDKSAKVKAERGASFEDIATALHEGGFIDLIDNPARTGQSFLIVRCKGDVWAAVIEWRGKVARIVTAYPSRKMRKKYEK